MHSAGVLQARSCSIPRTCCRCYNRAASCNAPLPSPRHTHSTSSPRPAGRPTPEQQHSWVCQAAANTELQQATEAATGSRWVPGCRRLPQHSLSANGSSITHIEGNAPRPPFTVGVWTLSIVSPRKPVHIVPRGVLTCRDTPARDVQIWEWHGEGKRRTHRIAYVTHGSGG